MPAPRALARSLVTEGPPWELAVLPCVSLEVKDGVPPQALAFVTFLGTLLPRRCCFEYLAVPEDGALSQST